MPVGKSSIARANKTKEVNSITVNVNQGQAVQIPGVPVEQLKTVPDTWLFYETDGIDMEDLKGSILKYGLLEPLTVRKLDDTSFQILSGLRRYKACKELGFETVRCNIVDNISDESARELFDTLHKDRTLIKSKTNDLHEAKFKMISSIKQQLPDYLL